MIDLSTLRPAQLLQLHAQLGDELRGRGILRSANNPTGDLAEYLFCKGFGWKQAENSSPNVDAISEADGSRYQIKGRRVTRHNKSRQLSAIRDFAGRNFDFLACVLFTEEYCVLRAAIIPYPIVEQRAKFIKRTNSHKFVLHDDVWNAAGVRDVTQQLTAVGL